MKPVWRLGIYHKPAIFNRNGREIARTDSSSWSRGRLRGRGLRNYNSPVCISRRIDDFRQWRSRWQVKMMMFLTSCQIKLMLPVSTLATKQGTLWESKEWGGRSVSDGISVDGPTEVHAGTRQCVIMGYCVVYRGQSSTVRKCVCRATGKQCAVKIVDKTQDPDIARVVCTEVMSLQDVCPHPYISEWPDSRCDT